MCSSHIFLDLPPPCNLPLLCTISVSIILSICSYNVPLLFCYNQASHHWFLSSFCFSLYVTPSNYFLHFLFIAFFPDSEKIVVACSKIKKTFEEGKEEGIKGRHDLIMYGCAALGELFLKQWTVSLWKFRRISGIIISQKHVEPKGGTKTTTSQQYVGIAKMNAYIFKKQSEIP